MSTRTWRGGGHVVTSSDHVVVGGKDVTSLDDDVRRRGAFWDDAVKLHSDFVLQHAALQTVLHCVPKKEATKLFAVTLSNLNRF